MNRPSPLSIARGAMLSASLLAASAAASEPEGFFFHKRLESEAAVEAIQVEEPRTKALWRRGLPGAAHILRAHIATEGASARERAESFLSKNAGLFAIDAQALRYRAESVAGDRVQVHFEQVHQGKVVYDRGVSVTLDATGHVIAASNNTFPVSEVKRAKMSEPDARAIARRSMGLATQGVDRERSEHVIVAGPAGAAEAVSLHVVANHSRLDVREVVIDLSSGEVHANRPLNRE